MSEKIPTEMTACNVKELAGWSTVSILGDKSVRTPFRSHVFWLRLHNALRVVPVLQESVTIYCKFAEITGTGATGAKSATVEKGRKIIDILEKRLLDF